MKQNSFLTAILFASFFAVQSASAQPNPLQIKLFAAQSSFEQGNYDEALVIFRELTQLAPDFLPAYEGIALAYRAKGDMTNAVKYFRTILEIDPKYVSALDQLGKILYSQGQFDEAEKYCLKALQENPNLTETKMTLGWLYLLGRTQPAKAIPYFEDVMRISDKHPDLYYGLGLAYMMENKRAAVLDAITQLKRHGLANEALQLETLLKDPRKVEITEGMPLVHGGMAYEKEKMYEMLPEDDSFKVRLRGELPAY